MLLYILVYMDIIVGVLAEMVGHLFQLILALYFIKKKLLKKF